MARTSKTKKVAAKAKVEEAPMGVNELVVEVGNSVENPEEVSKAEDQLPPYVELAMKSHPELESLYVNEKGFVFVNGTGAKMRGNAKLYSNKYYKK